MDSWREIDSLPINCEDSKVDRGTSKTKKLLKNPNEISEK